MNHLYHNLPKNNKLIFHLGEVGTVALKKWWAIVMFSIW